MKRNKEPRVVTFHTTAEAMAAERVCAGKKLAGKPISAPRALSADCGIAWYGSLEMRTVAESALSDARIEVAGIHELVM